jgi:hypothetical protein
MLFAGGAWAADPIGEPGRSFGKQIKTWRGATTTESKGVIVCK